MTKTSVFFDQVEDNVSWPPRSTSQFGLWKHFFNPICVTEILNRPSKGPNMVLNCKFSQPFRQYPVRAWAYAQSRLSLVRGIIGSIPQCMGSRRVCSIFTENNKNTRSLTICFESTSHIALTIYSVTFRYEILRWHEGK